MNFVFALLIFCSPVSLFAQDVPFFGGTHPPLTTISLEQQAVGQAPGTNRVAFMEQKLSASVPVVVRGDEAYSVTLRGQRVIIEEPLRFDDRGVDIPGIFGIAELGLAWSRRPTEGDKYSASFSIGSAGPRPLVTNDKPILNGLISWERPLPSGDGFIGFLAYSNNRTVLNNIPIPGGAYLMKRETLTLVLGAPFVFAMWRPGKWTLISMASPFAASAEVGVMPQPPLQFYANTAWTPRSYLNLLERDDDHLMYEKKEMGAGVRVFLSRATNFSVGWVREFDRRFLLAESLREQKSSAKRIEDADGVQFRARVGF